MALLVKGCKPEHNVKSSSTLRIGTLKYYQEHENPEIVDRDEGTYNFNISFEEPVTLDKTWAAALLQNIMHFEGVQISPAYGFTRSGKITSLSHCQNENTITFWNTSFEIERISHNSFVFCMTYAENFADAEGIFESYSDRWVVDEVYAEELANRLASGLGRAIIKGRENGKHVISENAPLERIQIKCSYRCVDYLSRNIEISNQASISVDAFLKLTSEMAFIKDPRDKKQKEFRFNLWVISDLNESTGMCREWPPVTDFVDIETAHIVPILAT